MKKLIFFFLVCLATVSISATEGEKSMSLNGDWLFRIDPYYQGDNEGWFQSASASVFGGRTIRVPGNWELSNETAYYSGVAWYRRSFEVAELLPEKVYRLLFEAVGVNYKLWVNDRPVADVVGGYFPRYFDVTSFLKRGTNSVVLRIDNNFRTGAYWSWGGIRRSVELIENNRERIDRLHITATPDLKKGTARVRIDASLVGNDSAPLSLDYEIRFQGRTLARKTVPVVSGQKQQYTFDLSKKEVALWHFDFPSLYTVEAKLRRGKVVLHSQSDRFGIREIRFEGNRFLLNGESVRLLGYNWVADDRFTGNTLPEEMYKRHIDEMKRAGCNMSRLSHVPLPKAVLDYLDEVGILIIDEVPVWGRSIFTRLDNPTAQEWLTLMVNNHYNHPSVVAWCVGNEIGSLRHNPDAVEYVRRSIEYVSTLDSLRPIIEVSMTAYWQKNDPSQYSRGMIGVNLYASSWSVNTDKCFALYNKPMFVTEFGYALIGDELTGDFAASRKALKEMRGKEHTFGASLWTFNDYRSTHRSPNLNWETPLSENRAWGVYDAYGNRKTAYYEARREYAPVRSMNVRVVSDRLEAEFFPRGILDLPSYTLREYSLRVTDFASDGSRLGESSTVLPVIRPGDPELKHSVKLPSANSSGRRVVSLVSPTGYAVLDTTLYLSVPATPEVYRAVTANRMVRFYFKPSDQATKYRLKLSSDKWSKEVETSIYDYLEINQGLTMDKRYQVEIVALNQAGESAPYRSEIVVSGDLELPPRIMGVRPTPLGGIGIGYLCEKNEYLYEVQAATDENFEEVVCRFQTHIKGACFTPPLPSGKIYFVRMRAVRQWQIPTEWTPVYSVKL